MINNRQAGRRRGRGGGGGGGGGNNGPRQGRPDNGNRIDSRARGNAAQLLEKYKNLAADAQRQGDRVNTEYYLQFADHYFRVLSDQRGRFEDQQPRRQREEFEVDGEDEFADEGEAIRPGEQQMDRRGDRQERGDRPDRPDRPDRSDPAERIDRSPRRARDGRDGQASAEPVARGMAVGEPPLEVAGQRRADPIEPAESLEARAEAVLEADAPLAPAPRRRGRPRRAATEQNGEGEGRGEASFDADRLPPALATPANDAGDTDEAPKPRRRRVRAPSTDTSDAAE